jgi:predicted RNA-binding protein with PUA-like domain
LQQEYTTGKYEKLRNFVVQIMRSFPTISHLSSTMHYWLIKSEPDVFSWDDFVRECANGGHTIWSGVRNYQARNNLRAMRIGDLALYYHSNIGKEVVGVAEIVCEAYQDPTTEAQQWLSVDVRPKYAFARPVSLEAIKSEAALATMGLIRQSRLSVVALTAEEFACVCAMDGVA